MKKNMKCLLCEGIMSTRIGSYKDEAIGLPNVTLVGIPISTCRKCGEVEVEIPRIEDLHNLIASTIIAKAGRLSGPEVRFLRKHINWSGAAFAKHFGCFRRNRFALGEQQRTDWTGQPTACCALPFNIKRPSRRYGVEDVARFDPDGKIQFHADSNETGTA